MRASESFVFHMNFLLQYVPKKFKQTFCLILVLEVCMIKYSLNFLDPFAVRVS